MFGFALRCWDGFGPIAKTANDAGSPCIAAVMRMAVKRAHLVDRCGLAEPEGPLLCRPAIGAFFRKKRRAKVRLGLLGYSTSPTLICRKATRQARRSGVSTVVWDRSIAAEDVERAAGWPTKSWLKVPDGPVCC